MAETNGHDGRPASGGATPPGDGNGPGNGNGNGSASRVAAVLAGAKAARARAVEEMKETIKAPEKTDLWKSVLRVKHDETPRSRALGVLSNVFLHLHPAKINRDAVAYKYTWG